MLRSNPRRFGRRALGALLVGVVSAASLVTLVAPASAAPPVGPSPAANATMTATPVDGLVAGQNVGYRIQTSGTTKLFGVAAHLCRTGLTGYNDSNFGYADASADRCVNSAPGQIVSGGLTAGTTYEQSTPFTGAEDDSGVINFTVGTGTVQWVNDLGGGPYTLTCDATHPCDLVVKVSLTGSPATTFFTQTLTFASAPNAPTGVTATAGSGQVTLNWTLPSQGAPFSSQHVHFVAPGAAGADIPLSGSATSTIVSGLANFTQYCFTIDATNGIGTGPASSPAACATPGPAGPAAVSASPGDGQVTLSWPSGGGTVTNHQVTVAPVPGGGNCATGTCLTGSTSNSFTVTGLTNGTTYTFTVAYVFAGGNSAPSPSASAAPGGAVIRQAITVTRPDGVLVISQYCSGSPTDAAGNFDPSNNNGNVAPNPIPNTLCNLTLSGPRSSRVFADVISAEPRTVHDAVTNGSTTVTSATAVFTANDVNQFVTGNGIPANTRIVTVTNATTVVLSNAATITFDGGDLSIAGNTLNFGTVSGFSITPSASSTFAAADVNDEIEGVQIPGGSHITNVVSATAVDISAPANNASNGFSARQWTVAPTPAHLITSGPHAGQYLEAQGKLRQIYVVDTRTADTGWTATGQVSAFSNGTATFSGDNLGWTPKNITKFSQPFTAPGESAYTMQPTKGASVAPGTGFGLGTGTTPSTDTLVSGNVPGVTLGYALTGHGLGLAALDADLLLWIPVQKPAGVYSATLTLTAV